MGLIVPDVGKVYICNRMVDNVPRDSIMYFARLKLFTNNYTPVAGSVVGDFTEAAWAGYAYQSTLAWASSVISGAYGQSAASVAHFGNSSGSDHLAYGVFITDPTDLIVIAAEIFVSGPRTVFNTIGFDYNLIWQVGSIY